MNEVMTLLTQADHLLFNVEVKGDSVALLDRARSLLKMAYDAAEKAEKTETEAAE